MVDFWLKAKKYINPEETQIVDKPNMTNLNIQKMSQGLTDNG